MDEFERQLMRAMAREDPPAWFEAKVLAATARSPVPKPGWWARTFGTRQLRWATAATAAVMMVVSGVAWREDRIAEQRAGEEARAKLEVALRITSAKLRHIEQRVATVQENN